MKLIFLKHVLITIAVNSLINSLTPILLPDKTCNLNSSLCTANGENDCNINCKTFNNDSKPYSPNIVDINCKETEEFQLVRFKERPSYRLFKYSTYFAQVR